MGLSWAWFCLLLAGRQPEVMQPFLHYTAFKQALYMDRVAK